MILRKLETEGELNRLKELYMASFPDSERKPFEMIEAFEKRGQTEILGVFDPDFAGLLITLHAQDDLMLIDYLAVDPRKRGLGVGSAALSLFEQAHPGVPVIIEIEDPEVYPGEDKIRRREFYFRNGFEQMPFAVDLFGVQMRILVRNGRITYPQYKDLLLRVLGDMAREHVTEV